MKDSAYICTTCSQPIPADHVFTYQQKAYCALHAPRESKRWGEATATTVSDEPAARPAAQSRLIASPNSVVILTVVGVACLAIGLTALLLSPSDPGQVGDAISMRRLVIGQTFTLAGVIMCAIAWQPR